jgi:hypothetical protein
MYNTTTLPSKHQLVTASCDDFGQYGSIFASDSDGDIPEPLNLYDETTNTEIVDNSNAERLK